MDNSWDCGILFIEVSALIWKQRWEEHENEQKNVDKQLELNIISFQAEVAS